MIRSPGLTGRLVPFARALRLVVFTPLLAAALASPGIAAASAAPKDVSGPFTSVVVPPPTCTSAVGICTLGKLTGDLPSSYYFIMDVLQPAGDPSDPTKFVYTGHSIITRTHGGAQLFGHDTGVLHMAPTGPSPFVTTVTLVGGTKQYNGASGQIVATGTLDFATGQAVGTYVGTIIKHAGVD